MIDNDSFGDVLERALADEPPLRGGSQEVFAAAGALRRRNRVLTGAAAVATVAVLAGAFLGVSALTHPGTKPVAQPAGPAVVTTPTPTSNPATAAQPTGPKIVNTLAMLLPGGSVKKQHTVDAENGGFVTYSDQSGKTLLMATLDADANQVYSGDKHGPGTGALEEMFKCSAALRTAPKGTTCETGTLPGGAKTIKVDGPNRGDYIGIKGVERSVSVLYPDGRLVTVSEWNLADPKRGPITRSTPVFALSQIYVFAISPAWTLL